MPDFVVDIQNLRISPGGRDILGVSELRISAGQVVGVLGPNGAGKSTLLKTCLGLQRIHQGTVRVLGCDISTLDERIARDLRCRIGYVPQGLIGPSQMPMTVREVVAMGRTGARGLFSPLTTQDWTLVDEWIDRMGISSLRTRAYGILSGGEQRKVLLAKAMTQNPKILMLDEPASHLDPGSREQMVALMENLYAQTKITMILVCHELETLPICCRRIVFLENGRKIQDGEPECVLTDRQIAALYGADLTVLHLNGRHMVAPKQGARHA